MNITRLQLNNIFICFLLNMLDGMDVMVISYAAPAISADWSIKPQALGVVFSMGLLGMTLGAMFLAPRADKTGRKAMIMFCNVLMGISVFATSFATSIEALILFRIISGLGIGALLACTATLSAEYAPPKTRAFWVSFAISGYPVGAVLSGFASADIIPTSGWQTMFRIAGICSFIILPAVYFFLKESPEFLKKKGENKKPVTVGSLLTPVYKFSTLMLWLALFSAFASLYFLTLWIPKLTSATGLSVELSIYAGTVFNLGAFAGIMLQGWLSSIFGLQKTICWFMLCTALLMLIFGMFSGSYVILILLCLLGFGIQGGFVGIYSLAAGLYPVDIRATGVGWAIGAGRVGAIAGPFAGGLLIGAGLSMATNFIVFAVPTVIAGVATLFVNRKAKQG